MKISVAIRNIEEAIRRIATAVNQNDDLRPYSKTVTVTSAYTMADNVNTVLADCSATAITVTLPTAVNNEQIYTVKKIDSSGNAVTIDAAGSETIDGSVTLSISTQWSSKTLTSNNANWFVV